MKLLYVNGIASVVLRVKLRKVSTGLGFTGLTSASSGLIISAIADNEAAPVVYTEAGGTIEAVMTLGTWADPTATKCRFKKVSDTNHPGVYEIQLADARFAVANARSLIVSISGVADLDECDAEIQTYSSAPPNVNASSVSNAAIKAATLDADTDTYQAEVDVLIDDNGGKDRYTVSWLKNGQPIFAGITLPKIVVTQANAGGTVLLALAAMTEIGSTGEFFKDEATARLVAGVAYKARVQATIDGSTRYWPARVGRAG